jgi:hypothetical protein
MEEAVTESPTEIGTNADREKRYGRHRGARAERDSSKSDDKDQSHQQSDRSAASKARR